MKNVLAIGGSYFLGRVFVEALAGDPAFRLFVVNRGTRPLGMEGVEEIVCDRNQVAQLQDRLPTLSWHAVVDFCGYTPQDIRNMVAALPSGSIGHYLFVSTVSVYAPTRSLPVREEAPKVAAPQPKLGQAANYGFQKWLAEQTLETYARRAGFPYTHLRPAILYGPYNYAPRESYFFDRIERDQVVVVPEKDLALFQFVFVRDAAEIITRSMGNPETFGRAFNLAAEELISYGRLIEVLERVTQRKVRTRALPAEKIEAERIPLPFPLDSHWIYSGQAARRILDAPYTPFPAGIAETYAWYRRHPSPDA